MGRPKETRSVWILAVLANAAVGSLLTNIIANSIGATLMKKWPTSIWIAWVASMVILLILAVRNETAGWKSGDTGGNTSSGGKNTQNKNITAGHNFAGRDYKPKIENNYFGAPPSSPKSSLHQLPAPPGDFTGRESELTELRDKLEREGVVISGMHGAGGIGKTALALKLAQQMAPRYPDADIYIDLKGASSAPVTTTEAMAHVIRAWDANARIPEDEAALRGLYQSTLHGKKALLLLDNASCKDQVEPLVPPETCLMIVTSRNRFKLPGCFRKNLHKMNPVDARDLLKGIAERLTNTEANTLAKACGHLPIALRNAAGSLAESPNISVEDYLGRLEATQNRLGLVAGVFDASYELMEKQLQRLWRQLGVFPGTFDDAGAASVWEMDKEKGQDALAELIRRSMVEWDEETKRYRLHDLARDFACSQMPGEESEQVSLRHAIYYAELLKLANDSLEQGGEAYMLAFTIFDLERQNIEAGWRWARERCEQREDAAGLCLHCAIGGADILHVRLHPRQLIDWMESARMLAVRLGNRNAEGSALGNLGIAYKDLGKYHEAIERHEQHLMIAREIGNKRSEGRALGNLGIVYTILGEHDRAIECYHQTLKISRETTDRRGEGKALGNLGGAYQTVGNYERAIEYYEQQLDITIEIGDRLGEGNGTYNKAVCLQAIGRPSESLECARAALEIYKQLDVPHMETARELMTELERSC